MAKKSHHAINIISLISLTGVMVGTIALVVILSVFNGFDSLVKSLINSFNPDFKITLAEGKAFQPPESLISGLQKTEGVYDICYILEDKALVRYDEQQTIADVRGVSNNYLEVSGIDSMIVEGNFILRGESGYFTVIGQGIKMFLNVMLNSPRQMVLYAPRQQATVSLDATRDLNRRYIQASGVFSIEQEYDTRYMIVPIEFARDLFDYRDGEITAIEIKTVRGFKLAAIQNRIQEVTGSEYLVQNRYQQNELFYKTMRTEKWAIFLILIFILIIASFNVIGTLTMLILEKKKDIVTLRNLGADTNLIKRIFLFEGWLISATGAVFGTIAGLFICWLQIKFEIIKLQGSGSFIIDAYPVLVSPVDVIITLVMVLAIGFIAAWFPIHYLTQKYIYIFSRETS
ncbi:MAG: ABC transporter permease [Bacteroidales bacterium]|nr:ABC transporter permease [Bacteroidales bacterium]